MAVVESWVQVAAYAHLCPLFVVSGLFWPVDPSTVVLRHWWPESHRQPPSDVVALSLCTRTLSIWKKCLATSWGILVYRQKCAGTLEQWQHYEAPTGLWARSDFHVSLHQRPLGLIFVLYFLSICSRGQTMYGLLDFWSFLLRWGYKVNDAVGEELERKWRLGRKITSPRLDAVPPGYWFRWQ